MMNPMFGKDSEECSEKAERLVNQRLLTQMTEADGMNRVQSGLTGDRGMELSEAPVSAARWSCAISKTKRDVICP